jgi:hypothetical protein
MYLANFIMQVEAVETAREIAGLSVAGILSLIILVLLGVISAMAGVIRYLYRHTREVQDLLRASDRLLVEQLAQLQTIPKEIKTNNENLLGHLTALITDMKVLNNRVIDRTAETQKAVAGCAAVQAASKELLQLIGSRGTSQKTSE